MTQSRATNIPLFLLSSLILQALESADLSIAEITTSCIILQYTTFFAFGGSNAISSVDLSSAYNGISGFNVVAVGALTLVSNWAGPIFWTSATNLLLLQNRRQRWTTGAFRSHVVLLTVFASTSVAFVMAACTALRTHLFIWTVFSPKYLYAMAWSLGQHLLINVAFGGFLYWVGT
jgi:ethanolaminephosphotransferase